MKPTGLERRIAGYCSFYRITIVMKNRIIQFPISEYPVLAGSGEDQDMS
jgi:hypothetical protein